MDNSDSNKPYYSKIAAGIMAKMGYDPSQGLGKNSQGIKDPIQSLIRPNRLGLGYLDVDAHVPPLAPEVKPLLPDIASPKAVAAEAKGPPNDDERIEIVQAEARKAWEELVSTVRGRESWGPEPLKQETPAEDDVLINKESFCQPPESELDFPASTFTHDFTHHIQQIGANTLMKKRRKSRRVNKQQETRIVATACARFSPDGMHLASCCSFDAFIKIWDYSTGILKMSFQDQTEDDHLLCIEFSQDSKRLASGSKNGNIKLYNTISGEILLTLEHAHSNGVTSLHFSEDGKELLSSSLDHKARIHDLGTLEMTKEFSGHSDSVNCAIYFSTDRILTASQDCTVKVWDPKTTTCLMTIEPALSMSMRRAPVNSIHMLPPKELGKAIVCSKSSTISIIDAFQGRLVRTMTSKVQGSAFTAACVSRKGNFIYAAGEDGMVYCFDYETGELKHRLEAKGGRICEVSHHPSRNLIVTCSKTSSLKLWSGWKR